MPGPTATGIFARAGQLDTLLGASMHKADPADVAREAVEALLDGRERVLAASVPVRLAARVSGLIPDAVKAELNRLIARPRRG